MTGYDVTEIRCLNTDDGELGSGLVGTVLLGDIQNFGKVALKCFGVQGGKKDKINIKNRISDEIKMLENANHDNIVRLYGWTEWPNAMALVMEYMAGGNLGTLLQNSHVKLRPGLQLRMSFDISKALAFIHNIPGKKRMTHGDIKPENVFINAHLICKVGDFGSAKLSTITGVSTTTAMSSSRKHREYTKTFASPKLLSNPLATITKEDDVFSFAMVVYFILFQKYPMGSTSLDNYIDAIMGGKRPSISVSEIKEDTTPEENEIVDLILAVIQECWQHNPATRANMSFVSKKLGELFMLQDISAITLQVSQIQKEMQFSTPTFTKHNTSPLHEFDPVRKCFTDSGGKAPFTGAGFSMAQSRVMTSSRPTADREIVADGGDASDETNPKTPISIQSLNINSPTTSNSSPPRPAPRGIRTPDPTTSRPTFSESAEPLKENELIRMQEAPYSFPTANFSVPVQQNVDRPPSNYGNEDLCFSEPSTQQKSTFPTSPPSAQTSSNLSSSKPNILNFDQMFEQGEGRELIQTYKQRLEAHQYNHARETAGKVLEFINSNSNMKVTLLKGAANRRRNEKKFLEAILFFEVAQLAYVHPNNHQNTVMGMEIYVKEMSKMCQENSGDFLKSPLREISTDYVIPRMVELLQEREKLPALQKGDKAKWIAKWWEWISETEQLVGKIKTSRRYLENAIEIVKSAHGKQDPYYKELVQRLQNHGKQNQN